MLTTAPSRSRPVETREVDLHIGFAGDLRSVGEAPVVQGDHRVRVGHATAPGRRLDEVDLGQDSPVLAGVHLHLPFPEQLISLATTFQAGFGTPATGE